MLTRLSNVLQHASSWRFVRAEGGVSAVEFALIAPLMITMLGGAVEVSGALTAGNRATYVADQIGEMVSRTGAPIGVDDMKGFIMAAALVDTDIITYARKSSAPTLKDAVHVNVTSVQFSLADSKCKTNCKYDANVVFSVALAGPTRTCGKLTAGSGETAGTLPADAFGPGALVVVDVEAFYKPLMSIILGDTISFRRSTYFRPREVGRVNYANNCAGYPST